MAAIEIEKPIHEPIMSLKGIGKSFGPVRALEDVGFDVYPGTVHGLVGENKTDKSTLMRILNGALKPDSGEILWHSRPIRFS